jgi:hypothetical protein
MPDAEIESALNADFLRQLVTLARTYGWRADYTEVEAFVRWCHEKLGVTPPEYKDMEPFEIFDED